MIQGGVKESTAGSCRPPKPCMNFFNLNECKFGKACHFSHVKADLDAFLASPPSHALIPIFEVHGKFFAALQISISESLNDLKLDPFRGHQHNDAETESFTACRETLEESTWSIYISPDIFEEKQNFIELLNPEWERDKVFMVRVGGLLVEDLRRLCEASDTNRDRLREPGRTQARQCAEFLSRQLASESLEQALESLSLNPAVDAIDSSADDFLDKKYSDCLQETLGISFDSMDSLKEVCSDRNHRRLRLASNIRVAGQIRSLLQIEPQLLDKITRLPLLKSEWSESDGIETLRVRSIPMSSVTVDQETAETSIISTRVKDMVRDRGDRDTSRQSSRGRGSRNRNGGGSSRGNSRTVVGNRNRNMSGERGNRY